MSKSAPLNKEKQNRRWTRYLSDLTTIVQIDAKNRKGKFTPTHNALLLNEAFKGCGFVLNATDVLQIGDLVTVKVGELEPMEAEVRWIEKLDGQVYKIGVFYLD